MTALGYALDYLYTVTNFYEVSYCYPQFFLILNKLNQLVRLVSLCYHSMTSGLLLWQFLVASDCLKSSNEEKKALEMGL